MKFILPILALVATVLSIEAYRLNERLQTTARELTMARAGLGAVQAEGAAKRMACGLRSFWLPLLTLVSMLGLLNARPAFAEDSALKVEILTKPVLRGGVPQGVPYRLINTSTKPLRLLLGSDGKGVSVLSGFEVTVRAKGGKAIISPSCGFVGSLFGQPEIMPENFITTLEPGKSVTGYAKGAWAIPEDGDYIVSLTYSMSEWTGPEPLHALYLVPENIWHGEVRAEAVQRFEAAAHPNPSFAVVAASVRRASQFLDESPEFQKEICERMLELNDPAAAPALERAVARGFLGFTTTALGDLGNEKSFVVLLGVLEKKQKLEVIPALVRLVQRSNEPLQSWMTAVGRIVQTPQEISSAWHEWWAEKKDTFKIVRIPDGRPRSEAASAAHEILGPVTR